jgi:hypothetical protein
MSPPLPFLDAKALTVLGKPLLPTPSIFTLSLVLRKILPALPCPKLNALITPPLVKNSALALTRISPPLPTPLRSTALDALLENPSFAPSKVTVSRALIVILPAFARELVLLEIIAPLVRESDPVVISISPPLPPGLFHSLKDVK